MIPWHQYLLGLIFLIAGVTHFTHSALYERIMPAYLPAHKSLILLSGILEMCLGFMLLNPETQTIAAWGMMISMFLFLSVHFHMATNKEANLNIPNWILWLRIPLQFGLIYWAYQYA